MMVDIRHIEKLLDRYMEGENTQEELRELKDYFRQAKDIPEGLLPYKEMFEVLEKPTVIPSVEALEALAAPRHGRKQGWLWYWIAAACVAGMIVMLLFPSANEERDAPRIAKAVTKVDKPKDIAPEPLAVVERQKAKGEGQKTKVKGQRSKVERQRVTEVASEEDDDMEIIVPSDEPKAYAASSATTEDDDYQDPDKVDDFIAKLALYNHAERVALKNASQNDDEQTAEVYVFQDNKDMDLFGKLLMVACWYKSDTPGYFLSFSQLQFLFRLKDMKKSRSRLWQAERIGNKILIYCANVPLGTKINSTIYKEYRQKFIQQNNITF